MLLKQEDSELAKKLHNNVLFDRINSSVLLFRKHLFSKRVKDIYLPPFEPKNFYSENLQIQQEIPIYFLQLLREIDKLLDLRLLQRKDYFFGYVNLTRICS
jgi:hypothetical protein